jgi:hypothetical protein
MTVMSSRPDSDLARIQLLDPTLLDEDDFLETDDDHAPLEAVEAHLLTVHVDCAFMYMPPMRGRIAVGACTSLDEEGFWWTADLSRPGSGDFVDRCPGSVHARLWMSPEDGNRAVLGHPVDRAWVRGDRRLVEQFVRAAFDRPRRILRALRKPPRPHPAGPGSTDR